MGTQNTDSSADGGGTGPTISCFCIQDLPVKVFAWGAAYFLCSASMLLANKVALHHAPLPVVITSAQFIFSALVPYLLGCFGVVEPQRLRWEVVREYWKVPALFAAAIFANVKVLETANVETFIVFRNTTPIFVCVCDFLFMGKSLPSLRGFAAFVTIVVGSVVYTATDEGFVLESYLWVCVYIVTIVTEMIVVKRVFNTVEMTTWTRVYYTNMLCLPFQPFLALVTSEQLKWAEVWSGQMSIGTPAVLAVALSCIGGLGISFSGTGFRNSVSATSFTLAGVTNKMLTVLINRLMWSRHAHNVGIAALALSILGSTMYEPPGKREPGSSSERLWQRIFGSEEDPEMEFEVLEHPVEACAALTPAADADGKE